MWIGKETIDSDDEDDYDLDNNKLADQDMAMHHSLWMKVSSSSLQHGAMHLNCILDEGVASVSDIAECSTSCILSNCRKLASSM